jgi:8-oxo-dGTP pyrophosphatase MutT (NUDIX family)
MPLKTRPTGNPMAKHPILKPSEQGQDCRAQYGALCWRMHRGKVEVLLITSRDTGRWVIPKGWPMAGLTPAEAAAREAWEEAGVEGAINPGDLGSFGYAKLISPKRSLPCVVQVFSLRVTALKAKFPERKERSRKWFALEKAARNVAEPELRALLLDLPAKLTLQIPSPLAAA